MKEITVENVTGKQPLVKKIKIYRSDTQNSITRRISRLFNTIPQFITFSSFNLDNPVVFYDLKTFINENHRGTLSLVLRSYSSKCMFTINEKNRDLILAEWIKREFEGKDRDVPDEIFLLGLKNNIRDYLNDQSRFGITDYDFQDTPEDTNIIIQNMKEYIKNYEGIVKQLNDKDKIVEKSFQEYEHVKPLESDMFISETTTFLTRTKNKKDADLRVLFDEIKTSEVIPFASFGDFYKVHSGQPILPEWTDQTTFSHIILKIKSDDEFSTCTVKIEDGLVVYETELQKYDENIIKLIADTLSVTIEETTEEKISGYFYMKFFFDKTILLDLISNNIVFSKIFFTNELLKPSRERKSIYTYFEDPDKPEYGVTTLSLSNQNYKKLPDKLKIESRLNKVNFVRCRISKARNRLVIKHIIDTICNVMPIYDIESNSIKKEYLKYIPDFEPNSPEEIVFKEDKTFDVLRSNVPDLFVKGYTRQCFNSPTIADEKDLSDKDKKNKSLFMKYPKDREDAKWYTCSDETDYKYIGLKKPKQLKDLDTAKYPYIPCCYKENQIEKSGTKYYKYVKNITDEQDKKQQDTIKTNKFVGFNHFGLLPANLSNFFTILDADEQDFFRKGVSSVYHTFLECVYEAMDDTFQTSSKENREIMLSRKIKEINRDKSLLSIGRQEMYDSDEIKIESEKYMQPGEWLSVLSYHFNCFIYVYRNVNGNAELLIPRNKNGHYELFRNMTTTSPVILIYEHKGGEFDISPVPRCELITRRQQDRTKYIHYFSKDSKHYTNIIRQIYSALKRVKYTYGFITKQDSSYKINGIETEILKQAVDSYGKTRLLRLKYKKNIVDIYTSPIQPLKAPIENYWNPVVSNNSVINELMSDSKERKVTDKIHAMEGVIGNVECIIPSSPSLTKNLKQLYLPIIVSNKSIYDQFIDHRKKSKYMIEHVIHAYSKWIEENQTKNVSEFFSQNVRLLSSDNIDYSLFFNGSKKVSIPKTSENNVLYALKLTEQRDRIGLMNFKDKLTVDNAYRDPEEFKKHSNEIIITNDEIWNEYIKQGESVNKYYVSLSKAVKDFAEEQTKSDNTKEYITSDEFKNKRFMFFFSNKNISNNTFVLLKCLDRKDAILQSANWIKYKYILPSSTLSNINTILPDIYVYLSAKQIQSKLRDGKSKILLSKINDTELSFAILEL